MGRPLEACAGSDGPYMFLGPEPLFFDSVGALSFAHAATV